MSVMQFVSFFSNAEGFFCFVFFSSIARLLLLCKRSNIAWNRQTKKQFWLYLFNVIIKEFIVKEQYKKSALYITYYYQKASKSIMLRQIVRSTEIYLKFIWNLSAAAFQSNCFKAVHASSNEQHLPHSVFT